MIERASDQLSVAQPMPQPFLNTLNQSDFAQGEKRRFFGELKLDERGLPPTEKLEVEVGGRGIYTPNKRCGLVP